MAQNPIIVALDMQDVAEASRLATTLAPHVGMVKLGLEFFIKNGPEGVKAVKKASGLPVFLDLKLYDIPNTVAGAVKSAVAMEVDMLTIHLSGGEEMCRAAKKAAEGSALQLLGVSVLTSMEEHDLRQTGIRSDVPAQVLRLGEIARKTQLHGMVCSGLELPVLSQRFNAQLQFVVPGIRPINADLGDQKRVMTPPAAIKAGATHLVIGRPITQADNQAEAAAEIVSSLDS